MITSVPLPDIFCPFPSAISSHVETVQESINFWMHHRGYFKTEKSYKHFQAGKFAWTTGRAHPTASAEALTLVATWMSWLFMLDDLCDEADLGKDPQGLYTLHHSIVTHMRHPRPMTVNDSAIMVGLHDIWMQMREGAPEGWVERFIDTFEDYAVGCLWEAQNRAENLTPSLADYLIMRRKTSALYIFFDLIERADAVHLPVEVLNNEIIVELKAMANDGVAWFNDIVSLEKEIRNQDVHNLVLVLQAEQDLTLAEAIHEAVNMFNERMRAYVALETQVPAFGTEVDAEVKRYLEGLRYWVRGNIDWSYETGRYGQSSAERNAIRLPEQSIK